MKKAFTLLGTILICVICLSQSPEKMSYQSIIRDSNGQLVVNHMVGVKINILQGSSEGSAIYTETHSPTTSLNGLMTIEIGSGVTTDDFSSIDWTAGPYFIQTEIDLDGETNYSVVGTSQLLSVPYALHSKTADSLTSVISEADPVFSGSVAGGITESDTSNWNRKDIYTAGAGINISELVISAADGISYIPIRTAGEIAALSPSAGETVYNDTEGLYQIYTGDKWVSIPALCWPQPTKADAGPDQLFNDSTIEVILAANIPEPEHGTGIWSKISGTGGSFADDTDPNTSFTGEVGEVYKLRWTISTNCGKSEDEISIVLLNNGAGQPVTDIEGNVYNTVYIGGQFWMAKNLKTTRYNDSTDIPLVEDGITWNILTSPAYCWYNNNQAAYKEIYGAIYNWYVINTGKLCPTGWHVPTDEEWIALTNYLGGEGVAGGKLKETGTSHWESPNAGATNETGFTAIPNGYRNYLGGWSSTENLSRYGYWWTSSQSVSDNPYYRIMEYNSTNVVRNALQKGLGIAVRCVKN